MDPSTSSAALVKRSSDHANDRSDLTFVPLPQTPTRKIRCLELQFLTLYCAEVNCEREMQPQAVSVYCPIHEPFNDEIYSERCPTILRN